MTSLDKKHLKQKCYRNFSHAKNITPMSLPFKQTTLKLLRGEKTDISFHNEGDKIIRRRFQISSGVWQPRTHTSIWDKYEFYHALKLFGAMVQGAENFPSLYRFLQKFSLTANWSNSPDKTYKSLLRRVSCLDNTAYHYNKGQNLLTVVLYYSR